MDTREIKSLLHNLKNGDIDIDDVMERLKHLPFEEIGCATLDHHRELRQGFPEVILGEGKSVGQLEKIIAAMLDQGNNILATRLDEDKAVRIRQGFPTALYHGDARCLTIEQKPVEMTGKGKILVVSAGTSDIPVAAEALVTARMMGNEVEHLFDVGVAGIHRLLARRELLLSAAVIVVVAGMEGRGGLRGEPDKSERLKAEG